MTDAQLALGPEIVGIGDFWKLFNSKQRRWVH